MKSAEHNSQNWTNKAKKAKQNNEKKTEIHLKIKTKDPQGILKQPETRSPCIY